MKARYAVAGFNSVRNVLAFSRPRGHFFLVSGLLLMTLSSFIACHSAQAEAEQEFPDPSSIILNQPIKVVAAPNSTDLFYEVRGTLSHAVQNSDLDTVLITTRPTVRLEGRTPDGTLVSAAQAQGFAEATSALHLPLQGGEQLNFTVLQYPFKAYLKASHDIEKICVSSDKLKDCENAPSIDFAEPMEASLPQSALEITSYKAFTERAGVPEGLIAVNGVAEIFLEGEAAKLRPELSVTVYTRDPSGKILKSKKLQANLAQLRHIQVPNPNMNQDGYSAPLLIYVVGLYQFAGTLPLTEDLAGIHAFLEDSTIQVKPAERSLLWLDSNEDGSLDDLDDYTGDGMIDHQDLFTT